MITLFLLFAVVLFGGFIYRVVSMVWGTPPDGVRRGEPWDVGHVPLIVTGVALMGFGLALPEPVRGLMDRAVAILMMR
jgi:hydrogenase-4 component F